MASKQAPSLLRMVGYVVIGAVVISLISKLAMYGTRYPPQVVKHVKQLIQTSSQSATMARQSTNIVIAFAQMNKAVACAEMARDVVLSKQDVTRMTGIRLDELLVLLKKEQNDLHKQIYATCPVLQPEGTYAVATGWIG